MCADSIELLWKTSEAITPDWLFRESSNPKRDETSDSSSPIVTELGISTALRPVGNLIKICMGPKIFTKKRRAWHIHIG